MLPNFLIAGAAKCGTTSLHYYLQEHPDIFMPGEIKETYFFSQISRHTFPEPPGHTYGTDKIWNLSDYSNLYKNAAGYKAVGEACTSYLYYHEKSMPRIVDTLGKDIKIIIILRRPDERAYSNYLHHVRDGLEPLNFHDALKAETQRIDDKWWWGFYYMDVGLYHEQVKSYMVTFGADNVLTILYDDLVSDPSALLKNIFKFLEVDDSFCPNLAKRYNTALVPRNKLLHLIVTTDNPVKSLFRLILPTTFDFRSRVKRKIKNMNLKKPDRKKLVEKNEKYRLIVKYREDILRLQDLLKKDLTVWLKKY